MGSDLWTAHRGVSDHWIRYHWCTDHPRAAEVFRRLVETAAVELVDLAASDARRRRLLRLTTWLYTQPVYLPHPSNESEQLLEQLGLVQHSSGNMDGSEGRSDAIPLSSLLVELGYGCCSSDVMMRRVFSSAGITAANAESALSDGEIARVLGKMTQTHSGLEDGGALTALANAASWNDVDLQLKPQTWNVECFISVVKEMVGIELALLSRLGFDIDLSSSLSQRPNVDWKSVVRSLDHDGFAVFDFRGFELLQKAVTLGSDDPKGSALESALEQWQHVAGQLSLIKQAILAPTEIFSFGRIGAPPVLTDAPEGARGLLDSTWNNQVLIETLVRAADSDSVSAVRDVFEHAISQAPELVAVGLAQMNVSCHRCRGFRTFHKFSCFFLATLDGIPRGGSLPGSRYRF